MKQRLVGTALGDVALRLREWWSLRTVPFANPEEAGMVANDILADRLLAGLAPPGGVFVDVGAQTGSSFSRAARQGQDLRIYAVEADPGKARWSEQRFPDITVFACAAGAEDSDDGSVRRLDDLMAGVDVDVIKVDLGGGELGALRGAADLIAQSRPTIMFKSLSPTAAEPNALGYRATDLWGYLSDQDYMIVTPERVAHDAPGLDLEGFAEAHFYPRRSRNYFAIARSRRTEIRDRARNALGGYLAA